LKIGPLASLLRWRRHWRSDVDFRCFFSLHRSKICHASTCDLFHLMTLNTCHMLWFSQSLLSVNVTSTLLPVSSPGFVARRAKKDMSWALTGATVARWLLVLWLLQYWSKKLWVVDICTSWSRRLHNTWIVGCHIYSKVN